MTRILVAFLLLFASAARAQAPLPAMSVGSMSVGGMNFSPPSVTKCVALTNTASTYNAGEQVGGVITLVDLWDTVKKSGTVQSVSVTSDRTQAAGALKLIFLTAAPTGGSLVDKAALNVLAADKKKVKWSVDLPTPNIDSTSMTFWDAAGIGKPIYSATKDQIAVLVATSPLAAFTTTDAIEVCVGVYRD